MNTNKTNENLEEHSEEWKKVYNTVSENVFLLKVMEEKYRDDKEILLATVKNCGIALEYASNRLKDDKDIVLAAVKNFGPALEYASDRLKADKEVVREANKNYGSSKEYDCSYPPLKFASEELKNDKEILMEAMNNDMGNAFRFIEEAGDKIKNDIDFAKWAINKNCRFFHYIGTSLQNNRELLKNALDNTIKEDKLLASASKTLQDDKDLVLYAIEKDVENYNYASEELKNDKEVAIVTTKNGGFRYLTNTFKCDKEIVLLAFSVDDDTLDLKNLSEELKRDKDVVMAAVKNNGNFIQYASEELKSDEDIILEAVKQTKSALEYVDAKLKDNKEFMIKAINIDRACIQYASERLKDDDELVLLSIKKYSKNYLEYVSERLRNKYINLIK